MESCMRLSSTLANTLPGTDNNVIPRQLLHSVKISFLWEWDDGYKNSLPGEILCFNHISFLISPVLMREYFNILVY